MAGAEHCDVKIAGSDSLHQHGRAVVFRPVERQRVAEHRARPHRQRASVACPEQFHGVIGDDGPRAIRTGDDHKWTGICISALHRVKPAIVRAGHRLEEHADRTATALAAIAAECVTALHDSPGWRIQAQLLHRQPNALVLELAAADGTEAPNRCDDHARTGLSWRGPAHLCNGHHARRLAAPASGE
jgi:hypothetical protein